MRQCRLCKTSDTEVVVDLGVQPLSGVFPQTLKETVPQGPLTVFVCRQCGLGQLGDSYPPEILYGDNYGYRSGLNRGMVAHLEGIASLLERKMVLRPKDTILDIGANDGTLLRSFKTNGLNKVAIDPTIRKFAHHYDESDGVIAIPELFSAEVFRSETPEQAKLITSIAMFYDLEDPVGFAEDIASILHPQGIWLLEQSYAPWMLRSAAYDTICHEHLEYYRLRDIVRIVTQAGLHVVDVATNQINGGSFTVSVSHPGSEHRVSPEVNWLLRQETQDIGELISMWRNFSDRIASQVASFRDLLGTLSESGKSIAALGASTKGNILLNTCSIDTSLISVIGEVNPDKYGHVTPGSGIPIIPETEVIDSNPEYIVLLPWHFREGLLRKLDRYLGNGGKVILPLPDVEIVTG